jgi:hypothetical protein
MYYLESVTNSSITIKGIGYDCSKESDNLDLPQNIGNIGAMTLNVSCSVNESVRAAMVPLAKTTDVSGAYVLYSLDKSNWSQISLIGAENIVIGPTSRFRTYSRNNINIDLTQFANGEACTLYVYFKATEGATVKTDPVSDPTINPYEVYFTKVANISFTDGTSFIPEITSGNNAEVIGRFYLSADVDGATMTAASIDLEGTRSGFSNFKLWASDDNILDIGEDEYIRTVSDDPGSSPLEYSSFSVSLTTSGKYIILSADVAEDATGSIRASILDETALTITDGEINTTISAAYMSSTSIDIPTPVELAFITSEVREGTVYLNWRTESETENSHFIIYRNGEKVGQVPGQGTCSDAHDYCFTDPMIIAGVYEYVLADVSFSGHESRQAPVYVEIEKHEVFADFVLEQAYPNPFNPSTTISYRLSADSHIDLSIYNTSGKNIGTLFTGEQNAGRHQVIWNAPGLPSGIYVVRLMSDGMLQTMKIVLMK